MTTVILAEKPDQARAYMKGLDIPFTGKASSGVGGTFLDSETVVVSAAGHLIELGEPQNYGEEYKDRNNMDILPLIPPRFLDSIPKEKSRYFFNIKKYLERADQIIVATDKDDEGCAIAFNILRRCHLIRHKNIKRAYPSAMNKKAVQRQFKHLELIDDTWHHAYAAIARARSDWLIGINLSRLYTHSLAEIGIHGNFAVGRAISTTLNLICRWYQEIENFKEQPIYELKGSVEINGNQVPLVSQLKVTGTEKVNAKREYIAQLKQHQILKPLLPGIVKKVSSEVKKQYAPMLMTKGDLYKEMNRVAGWPQSRSKKVMQQNYEQGYQTYPRTDSGKITKYMYDYLYSLFDSYMSALDDKVKYVRYLYSDDELRKYITKEESAGAHMAIIPTEKVMTADCDVTEDQRLMWEVVVRKSLALAVEPYKYVSNYLEVDVNRVKFTTSNSEKISEGWKQLLLPSKKRKDSSTIPSGVDYRQYISEGQRIMVQLENFQDKTRPLKPLKSIQIYDKGGLMEQAYKYVDSEKYAKILKKSKGIGTSATRDQAMTSLVQKKYVIIDNKDIISVTPEGWVMNCLLKNSQVNDPILTAQWEEEYELIGKGANDFKELVNTTAHLVYHEFDSLERSWHPELIKTYYDERLRKLNNELSIGQCPVCLNDVTFVRIKGRKGTYEAYSCTNKDCDFSIPYHFCNKTISISNASKLLAMEKTNTIKQMSGRSEIHFDAKLVLKYDEYVGKYKIQIVKKPHDERNSRKIKKGYEFRFRQF